MLVFFCSSQVHTLSGGCLPQEHSCACVGAEKNKSHHPRDNLSAYFNRIFNMVHLADLVMTIIVYQRMFFYLKRLEILQLKGRSTWSHRVKCFAQRNNSNVVVEDINSQVSGFYSLMSPVHRQDRKQVPQFMSR